MIFALKRKPFDNAERNKAAVEIVPQEHISNISNFKAVTPDQAAYGRL
jgi:hypothetical protein